ncbi:MAG: Arc family DNA-binding protein [Gammaproteobacteria bacterium]
MAEQTLYRVTLKLPADLRNWLRAQAKAEHRSMHAQILMLLTAAKATG